MADCAGFGIEDLGDWGMRGYYVTSLFCVFVSIELFCM